MMTSCSMPRQRDDGCCATPATLWTYRRTDRQTDRQTGRRHARKWITNEQGRGHKVAFHLIPERYGQTDGRTDGQTDRRHACKWITTKNRLSYITRWRNDNRCWRSGCTVLHSKPTHQPRYGHTDGRTGRWTDRQVDVMPIGMTR